MLKLNLEKQEKCINISDVYLKSFEKPIVFFKIHKDDARKILLTFIIFDAQKGKLTYLFSYNQENRSILESAQDNQKYQLRLVPHSTIEIRKDIDFFTFMQEEQVFMYVNYRDNILKIYTMEDVIGNDIKFKIISSTFYKDANDSNYFYIGASDIDNMFYIYRISLDLQHVELIDSFPGRNIPPHVVRSYKDCIMLSHEFNESNYYLQNKKNKKITSFEMGNIFVKNSIKIKMANPQLKENELKMKIYEFIKKEYNIKCVPGAIILFDNQTKERTTYKTSGGSPAHFEIDEKEDMIYVSSHNFFNRLDSMSMFEPAVFDKFHYINNKLEWRNSFSYPKGYRYASRRVFYNDGKPYICTFGQPNRLIIIDATTMKLHYYVDIGQDELSSQEDIENYLNSRDSGGEFVALEVSQNGENIIFLDNQYLYIFNFTQKSVIHKFDYSNYEKENWDDFILRTLHIMFLQ